MRPNQIGRRRSSHAWKETIFLTISELKTEGLSVMLSCRGRPTCCVTNLIVGGRGGGGGGKVELPSQTHIMHYAIMLTLVSLGESNIGLAS